MPICVELSRKTFPDLYQGIAMAETRIAWLEKNPDICYVCRYQGRIVGYTTLLPLKEQKIEKILSNQEFVRNINTTQRNFVIDVEESGIPFLQKYKEVLAEQNVQKHTEITSQAIEGPNRPPMGSQEENADSKTGKKARTMANTGAQNGTQRASPSRANKAL